MTIVAETVTEIAIVCVPRGNYAILTFCLGDLLFGKFVVASVALIERAIEVVRGDHESVRSFVVSPANIGDENIQVFAPTFAPEF